MGAGDEIMATAQARAAGRKVSILDKNGNQRWHALWAGNPNIAVPGEHCEGSIVNGPSARPYIDYSRMQEDYGRLIPGGVWCSKRRDARLPWRFTDWSCDAVGPGDLYLTDAERALAQPALVVEPHVKESAMPGKRWAFARYAAAVKARPDLPWAQFDYGFPIIPGARRIATRSFREACGVLSGAVGYLGSEGGLHHASAALGIPAVVIFGGVISPRTTGYRAHRNLFRDDPAAIGARVLTRAAARAIEAITVDEVLEALETLNATPESQAARRRVAT